MNIVAATSAKPTYDDKANVNYLVYGQDNWISYDDKRTFERKIEFANERGLNGLMIWAIDLDGSKHSALSALTGNPVTGFDPIKDTSNRGATIGHSTDDASKCRVTERNSFCTQAETAVGRVGTIGGDTSTACGGDAPGARWVCCPAWTNLTPESCHWDAGGGAVITDCSGKCNIGDVELFSDPWGWEGDVKYGDYGSKCLRGNKVFCCTTGNLRQYLDICTWTECEGACPSDKQHVLTTDAGGNSSTCDPHVNNDAFNNSPPGGPQGDYDDPTVGSNSVRKLCCPRADSFKNCGWRNGDVCSNHCDDYQITLDLDPLGAGLPGAYYCANGRKQVFCCDVPGRKDQPFLPVSLDRLFPPEHRPPPDTLPDFELVNFNSGPLAADPNESGAAFFFLAGSDTAVSSMSKRDNPGLHFLDCPCNILNQPLQSIQTARVICFDSDVNVCFGVRKNGVEGTIVHMPSDCGNGTYARAVSLIPSRNQSVPVELAMHRDPTSAVYDFTFDYDMALVRRDAGDFSIRMDYSNVRGYWDAVVDSDGISAKKRPSLGSS